MLLDLLFPRFCINCNTPGVYICQTCATQITRHKQICINCNKIAQLGKTHENCLRHTNLDGIIIATEYKHLMRKLVGKIKYGLNYALLEELLIKTLISEKIKVCLQQENIHLATEVPMHKHKQNQRGFNQATLIAQWLQKNYNLPHHTLLTKNKQTTPQMQLTRYDRVFNLQNAFEINTKQNIENKNILIVDDIITTGTTLEECARVLKKHGAHKVWGLALASGRN